MPTTRASCLESALTPNAAHPWGPAMNIAEAGGSLHPKLSLGPKKTQLLAPISCSSTHFLPTVGLTFTSLGSPHIPQHPILTHHTHTSPPHKPHHKPHPHTPHRHPHSNHTTYTTHTHHITHTTYPHTRHTNHTHTPHTHTHHTTLNTLHHTLTTISHTTLTHTTFTHTTQYTQHSTHTYTPPHTQKNSFFQQICALPLCASH